MCRCAYTLLCFLLLIKQYSFCRCFNTTICYKLFFSNSSISQNNTAEIITPASNVTLTSDRNISKYDSCIEPGYEKICSGRGQCINSSCKCDRLEPLQNENESLYEYSGPFCEECPYCKGQRCKKLYPCLDCILQNTSCENDCYFYYNLVDNVEKYEYKDKMCVMEENNGCITNFKYFYDKNNELFLSIERYKHCANGTKYLLYCCYAFLVYIIVLMVISKKLLNGIYYVPDSKF